MIEALSELPCPALVSDIRGRVLAANQELLTLAGGADRQWNAETLDALFPPGARIFLQTHVWPMLLRDGEVREIYSHLRSVDGQRLPVMLNCKRGTFRDSEAYFWLFFIALERSRFENELLYARNRALTSALALAKSERFMRNIADATPGLVAYWDKDLRCRFANQQYLEWFGRRPEEMLGTSLQELLGERLFALNEPHIRAALSGERRQFERVLTKADGKLAYTLASYVPDVDEDANVAGFSVLVSDVTPLKEAERESSLARRVYQSTDEGIMVTDAHGMVLSINPAFLEITGYSESDVLGCSARMLRAHGHDGEAFDKLWRVVGDTGVWKGETWNRRKNGGVFLARETVSLIRSSHDEPLRFVSVFNDITARWRDDERLRSLAFHDPLTQLPNRPLLMERLEHLVTLAHREHRTLAVLFIDLDGFKLVNDTLGHDVGDEVLRAVARTLKSQLRETDTAARLGGDEFVVLLDNPENQLEVARIAGRLVTRLSAPMDVCGKLVQISASIGIAMPPTGGDDAARLLKSADTAMYAAKEGGKNAHRCFDPAMELRPSRPAVG